jgi:quinolinate synthase
MSGTLKKASNYIDIPDEEIIEKIKEHKERLKEKLLILGHHYQRLENVKLADYLGDSYELSKRASEHAECDFILFCGVHFMAESARILAQANQRVFLPNMAAGCPMADMASLPEVEEAWDVVSTAVPNETIIPITYMNSDARIKAFCGRHGGLVCTSSNAQSAFKWAFERGQKIFFFPDEHLGRNTANAMSIPRDAIALWDPKEEMGCLSKQEIERARIVLWSGSCHVHTFFQKEHVELARKQYPDCTVVVHPECPEQIVKAADCNGSTSYIVKLVEAAAPGSTIVIGTEINLIQRLALDHPELTIVPLARSLCPNMYKTSIRDILVCLDNLGEVDEIIVPDEVAADAKLALDRMLMVQ